MEIFATIVLLVLGGILGLSASTLYHMYDEGWKKDEAAKERLRQRVDFLESVVSRAGEWNSHYSWRVDQLEERLKKLEPTEVTE
jgi:hypothetical protein